MVFQCVELGRLSLARPDLEETTATRGHDSSEQLHWLLFVISWSFSLGFQPPQHLCQELNLPPAETHLLVYLKPTPPSFNTQVLALRRDQSITEKPKETNLYSAVHSAREEAAPGDCKGSDTALVPQQRLSTDHVVHAPHLWAHRRHETEEDYSSILSLLMLCHNNSAKSTDPAAQPWTRTLRDRSYDALKTLV